MAYIHALLVLQCCLCLHLCLCKACCTLAKGAKVTEAYQDAQGREQSWCDAVWEMYTGSSLFKGLTVGQVFFMVVYEAHRPAIPEDCPEAFQTLMTSCWSADPPQRCVACGNIHCL